VATSQRGNLDRYKLLGEKLCVGQKLPCHAFTRDGVLLLARGETLATPTQLDRLLYPDIIFSNDPPAVLLPAIRKQQAALGIIEDSRIDKQLAEELTALPLEKELALQTIALEPAPPVVSFAEEITCARDLHQEAVYHVVDLLAQVRAGKSLDLYETTNLMHGVMESLKRNVRAFSSLLHLKVMDEFAFAHSINTCIFALMLARNVKPLINLNTMGIGALLHDIGKSFLPPGLLSKEDHLTEADWELIRMHPQAGVDIIELAKGYQKEYVDPILLHHERLDGSGYPAKLGGKDIALMGRITAIADVYDAMTTDRPYRASFSPPTAMRWISSHADVLFDQELVRTFIAVIGIFPVASLARMNTGELALVVKVNPQAVLKPIVLVVTDSDGTPLFKPKLINLAVPPFSYTKEILGLENARDFRINVDEYLASIPEEKIADLESEALSMKASAETFSALDTLA